MQRELEKTLKILKTYGGMGEEAGAARISNISYGPSHVANHYKVV